MHSWDFTRESEETREHEGVEFPMGPEVAGLFKHLTPLLHPYSLSLITPDLLLRDDEIVEPHLIVVIAEAVPADHEFDELALEKRGA